MEMILRRIAKKQDYTIGWLYLNRGEKKFCDTLEPPVLEKKTSLRREVILRSKKKAQALKPFAIPEGRYAVVISFSPTKKRWLPILLGVPMFQGIRIHAGNTAKDTLGCILPGDNRRKGMVLDSRIWEGRLIKKIMEAQEKGESIWITVE